MRERHSSWGTPVIFVEYSLILLCVADYIGLSRSVQQLCFN